MTKKMLKDSQIGLRISIEQRSDEKTVYQGIISELDSLINFLHIEVEEKNKTILGLLPESERILLDIATVFN